MTPRQSPAQIYVEVDGVRWRVHDCLFTDGRFRRCASMPSPIATSRVFVAADGARKSYRFKPREDRTLAPGALHEQLRAAGYLPTEQYDPSTREAR